MAETEKPADREAQHGEKMIEVKIRFWTDGLAAESGKNQPKHAWAAGVVCMDSNRSHGISPKNPVPFNSLLDVGAKIEQVLLDHGVVLHRSTRMKKYISSE
jgi:hypothetical protein